MKNPQGIQYSILCGYIWHGNTRYHYDIRRQSETDFEVSERKRVEIDKEIRHFLFKLEQEVPDFCLKEFTVLKT
ncbi:hypothetical protein [Psychrobacillus sp. FSL H8-0484]|uniref:hypothetical protein n=1 Tax=Psychrobacillus sp. FSL H8-0484 TaxID=2921390 RepID=UPI004046B5CD